MRVFCALVCLFLWLTPALHAASSRPALPTSAVGNNPNDVRPPAVTPAMRRYSRNRDILYFVGTAYGMGMLWGVLASGLSARLRTIAERLHWARFWTLLVYYALLTLALAVIGFPLAFYSGYWLEHQYGLSSQSFGGWLADRTKSEAVGLAINVPVLWLVFRLIKKSPRRWALWLWGALIPLLAFGIFLEPVLIEPLFNKFTPLPSGPLRTQIHALAAQAGIPDAPISVADESRRTNTTNAYVTGIGSTARIVIWDTTLKQLPDDEIVGIVGHEMGHYVEKHILWGFAASVLALLVALPLAQKVIEWLMRRCGPRWRLRGLDDFATIPVFLLTVSLLSFLADPLTNGASRYIEHRADAYGLRVTHNGPAMARAFVFFARHDLQEPYPPPFVKFWMDTHPPLGERIDFVMGRKSPGDGE